MKHVAEETLSLVYKCPFSITFEFCGEHSVKKQQDTAQLTGVPSFGKPIKCWLQGKAWVVFTVLLHDKQVMFAREYLGPENFWWQR